MELENLDKNARIIIYNDDTHGERIFINGLFIGNSDDTESTTARIFE